MNFINGNFQEDLNKYNNSFDNNGNLNNNNQINHNGNINVSNVFEKEDDENDILNNFYKCDGNFLNQFNNYNINDKPNNLFEFYMNQSHNFNYVNPFNYYSTPKFNQKK